MTYFAPTLTATNRKLDEDKPPVHEGVFAQFPLALQAVANVSLFGAKKYDVAVGDRNWRNGADALNRYRNAKARHALATELWCADSDLLHAAHEAWNALAVLELLLEHDPFVDNTREG